MRMKTAGYLNLKKTPGAEKQFSFNGRLYLPVEKLKEYLIKDEEDENSDNDFGKT